MTSEAAGSSQFGVHAKGSTPLGVCPVTIPVGEIYPNTARLSTYGYSRSSTRLVSCRVTSGDEFGRRTTGRIHQNTSYVPFDGGQPRYGSTVEVFHDTWSTLFIVCDLPGSTSLGFSYLTTIDLVLL
jgi:hypothetical protein